MTTAIDVASFLPETFRNDRLPQETADNIQHILDGIDVREQVLIDKYRTTATAHEIIDELGLSYIAEFVLAAGYTLAQLHGILVILHHYKGTRFGVEMLLNLLGMTGLTGTASLVEWWEDPLTPGAILPAAQRGTPNTYKIHITLVSGAATPVAVFLAFNKMSPQYVLPALDIGTVFTGETIVYFDAIGRPVYTYTAVATESITPIYYVEAMGRTQINIKTAATI